MQLSIYTDIRGTLLYDFSIRAFDREFGTDEHGFGYLSFSIKVPTNTRSRLQKYKKVAYVRLGEAGKVIWEGRLEEIQFENEITRIIARGYIQAFTDLRVTDIWSTTELSFWKPSVKEFSADNEYDDEKFNFDTQGRLFIGVKTNTTYGNNPDILGGLEFENLSGSSRPFTTASFVGSGILGSSFAYGLITRTAYNIAGTTVWASTSDGNIPVTVHFPQARDFLQFFFYRNNTNVLFIGDDNAINMTISGIRIGTTVSISGARLYADEILRATISGVYNLNPTQINTASDYIQSPATDLKDVVFQDVTGLDVIKFLVDKPDSQSRLWECKIWDDQRVWFQPKGTVYKTWYISFSDLKLGFAIPKIYNSTRTKYKNVRDQEVRTAYTTSGVSVSALGLTRQNIVALDTTDNTLAGYATTASLNDTTTKKTQSTIDTQWVYDTGGARRAGYYVRSGDKILLRNVPIDLVNEIETVFFVKETIYNVDTKQLSLIPQEEIPTLTALLKQIGKT